MGYSEPSVGSEVRWLVGEVHLWRSWMPILPAAHPSRASSILVASTGSPRQATAGFGRTHRACGRRPKAASNKEFMARHSTNRHARSIRLSPKPDVGVQIRVHTSFVLYPISSVMYCTERPKAASCWRTLMSQSPWPGSLAKPPELRGLPGTAHYAKRTTCRTASPRAKASKAGLISSRAMVRVSSRSTGRSPAW